MKKSGEEFTILFMGTYPPRECGIATFTKDISDAIDKRFSPKIQTKILAINKNGTNIYNYPKKVIYQISDNDIEDYIENAKKINRAEHIKLVCIQHEFGIFGGEYGDHLLAFLEILEKPVVMTFHSVLPSPDDRLRKAVRALAEKVKAFVVMNRKAIEILKRDYEITTPIRVVPHGIPTVKFESQEREKENLGYKNRKILSSFGMIGPGKGYEEAIDSMVDVVEKHPDALYLIVGETHPVVRRDQGEEYRNFLESKVKKLKLQKNVKFYNKYLTLDEIIKYLKATDVYLSCSTNPNQITSGTLSYAMGCGRPIISTPFLHALDAIKPDKGLLVKFNRPKSFSRAIIKLLSDESMRKDMEKHAYHHTRHMTWPNVAYAYGQIFRESLGLSEVVSLPKVDVSHLARMTDDFGIIQFANQSEPDKKSGYMLDDNARALLVCAMHYNKFKEFKMLKMIKLFLDYIKFVQDKDGKLYNFVDENRKLDRSSWSEDAQGRAMWALGHVVAMNSLPEDLKAEAEKIMFKSLSITKKMTSPRSMAFTIIGLYHYNLVKNSFYIKRIIQSLADKLSNLYEAHSSEEWAWFEPYLTYANSKLSEAMFYAYLSNGTKRYFKIAKRSLYFLLSKTFEKGTFIPIGQRKWYLKGEERSYFDQQPIEAAYTLQTLLTAYGATNQVHYRRKAIDAFNWFMGKNIHNQTIYDESTGGCFDGLGEQTININQGAESTLSYLLARLSLEQI